MLLEEKTATIILKIYLRKHDVNIHKCEEEYFAQFLGIVRVNLKRNSQARLNNP